MAVAASALALITAACTSSHTSPASQTARSDSTVAGVVTTAPAAGAPPAPAGTDATGAATPAADGRPTGTASRPAGGPATRATATPAALFPARDDRVGISDTSVRVCTHLRKYLGRVLDVEEEDSLVYWRMVNDLGGIHGRMIDERFAEDAGGRLVAQAYEECRGSFLLRGAPGAEAIVPMRRIVEGDRHPLPYLHFTVRTDPNARYSFSWYPSHETFGRLTAQFVLSRFPGARIGLIHKDSDSWDAGRQGFVDALTEAGVSPVADVPLTPEDPIVADELAAVQRAGADVVWAWVEVLDVVQLVKQSNAQRYSMRWVVPFAFNTLTDALGDDALRPAPITGLNVTPPATPGEYGGSSAPHAEYRRFEEAYRRYRGKAVPRKVADLLFLKWLDDRHVARLLERCGRDCTRNRLVAPLVDGSFAPLDAVCPFDFRRGRVAGYRASALEAAPTPSGPIWVETARCVERF